MNSIFRLKVCIHFHSLGMELYHVLINNSIDEIIKLSGCSMTMLYENKSTVKIFSKNIGYSEILVIIIKISASG